jgi:hypothetical protein
VKKPVNPSGPKKYGNIGIGDFVTVIKIPPGLKDVAGLQTKRVFRNSLGKTCRVEGIDNYGHLELVISRRDTIWIEPEFVVRRPEFRADWVNHLRE